MSKVILGTTMSMDGFMADRNGDISCLYPNLSDLGNTEMLQESIERTGALIMGRRTFDMAQGDLTDYEFQVPIFVLTHKAPETPTKGQNDNLTITFVLDGLESAIRQAKAAAGDKDVQVIGGASTSQQIMRAGLFDELHIGIAPLLLGEGLKFFEDTGGEQLALEKIKVMESPNRTDILFRVVK